MNNEARVQYSRSPYAVGAGLGVLSAFAFATAKRGLGVTTAFESAAALTERAVAPRATHVNDFVKEADEIIGRMSFFQGGAIVWLHETDKWVLLKRTEDGRLLVYQRQRTTEQEAERVAGFVEIAFRIARSALGV